MTVTLTRIGERHRKRPAVRAAVYPASLRAASSITFVTASGRNSGGPRGSLGHYFPDGKTQLVTEAIDLALAELFVELERTVNEAETFAEAIGGNLAPWRYLLVEHDFALGCPLAATVVDTGVANPDLRVHVGEMLARYQAAVASVYVKFGDPPAHAAEQSTVLLAALEGALILARARRDTEPLDMVERHFASRVPTPA